MKFSKVHSLAMYLQQYGLMTADDSTDIWETLNQRDPDLATFTTAYKNVKFGWEAMEALANANIPYPPWLNGNDICLYKLYSYARGSKADNDTLRALSYMTPCMKTERNILEGMLLVQDATIPQISKALGVSPKVIHLYEKAFFNVRDRMADMTYMQGIVYPDSRMVEMMDGYLQSEDMKYIMKRAGYNDGAGSVLYFGGFPTSAVQAMTQSVGQSARALEANFMATGLMLARAGLVHQTGLPALRAAIQMIAVSKMGGNEQGVGAEDELPGIGAFYKAEMKNAAAVRLSGLKKESLTIDVSGPAKQGLQADPVSDAAKNAGVPVFKPKKADAT